VSPTTTEPTPNMEVTKKECYGTFQSCSLSYTYGEQHDAADWSLHYSNRTCKLQQSMLSVSKTACLCISLFEWITYIIQVALHNARTTHRHSTKLYTTLIWNMCIIQLALCCASKIARLQTGGLCAAKLKGNVHNAGGFALG